MIKKSYSKLRSIFSNKDRGSFRLKRIILTGLSAFGSKGITMLVSIISLPLCLHYLGAERFGMMETIVSLIMILSFADLGLGFGLQNRIAELEASEDKSELPKAISTTFLALLAFTGLLAIGFLLSYSFVAWEKIFNVKGDLAIQEAPLAVGVFFLCFMLQIPFSIVRKVQLGFQEGYINEIWRSAGQVMGLIGLFVVIYLELGIHFLILAVYGSNCLFMILNFLFQFFFKRKHLLPSFAQFDWQLFKKLYKDGVIFFTLQIATIVLISSDRIIIAQCISAEAVAIYSVGYRLAAIFIYPVSAFVLPLLPAFNDALAKGDNPWVRKILRKTFLVSILVSLVLGLSLYLFGNDIIGLWVGKDIQLSMFLLLAFAAFIIYSNVNAVISNIMLTPILINKLILIFILGVSLSIFLKFLLIPALGIAGVLIATIIGMSTLFFIPSIVFIKQKELI